MLIFHLIQPVYINKKVLWLFVICFNVWIPIHRDRRDRVVIGFTITSEISAYHHRCCELESRSGRGVQQYVVKLDCDLRQVGGFLRVLRFPPPMKLTHNITEILLKVALNTIKQTQKQTNLEDIHLHLSYSNSRTCRKRRTMQSYAV